LGYHVITLHGEAYSKEKQFLLPNCIIWDWATLRSQWEEW